MAGAAPSRILSDPIGTFLPGCPEDERALRERLFMAREIATSRVVHTQSDNAKALLWMILETVAAWLYAPAPSDELQGIVDQCLRLAQRASFFERQLRGDV